MRSVVFVFATLLLLSSSSGAQTSGWTCHSKCIDAGIRWHGDTRYLFRGGQYIGFTAVAAANYARSLAFVDRNRIVLAGNSTGGLATIVASGSVLPDGVIAALNFAGGHGGGILGPRLHCNESEISRLAAEVGRTARIPMLWLYARDDVLWGPDFPRQWYTAFTNAGGLAKFSMFDRGGHDLVSYPELWGPVAGAFLTGIGVPMRP